MLTRQWQFGEFRGEDAGSPATVQYRLQTIRPMGYRSRGLPAGDLPDGLPLETVVERRPLPFRIGAVPISFDLRLLMGRRWLKLVRPTRRDDYRERWPIRLPDPEAEPDTALVAHAEVWATMQAVAGRAMDGYELYAHLKGGRHAWDGIDNVSELEKENLDSLGRRFVDWFDDLIRQPSTVHAYDPSRLEHRFDLAAADDSTILTAEEYPGGHIDWHTFSHGGADVEPAAPGERIRTVIPGPVRFSGMPLPRLWAMEDGRTDFGAVTADTTDLLRLLFVEFALVYGNDWYVLPCDLDTGTLARLDGLVVTDVFGRRFWVDPAGVGPNAAWQRWSIFNLGARPGMFLPPSVRSVADGPVTEEVLLIRDEAANMVWGVERLILLATRTPLRGDEAARETLAHHRRPITRAEPTASPPIAYQAMNAVPENWIPFIPVHVSGGNREIQLQRGAMPRVLDGGTTPLPPVQPRTTLLREGLDEERSYFIHEEEVPRAGTRLSASYRRTRMPDGRPVIWYAIRRTSGRGEGSSSLEWDRLVDPQVTAPPMH